MGFIYADITNTSLKMGALVFAISKIADVAFFACGAFISTATGYGNASIHRAYDYTSGITNALTITAMYRLGLIGQTGVAILTGLSILHFNCN